VAIIGAGPGGMFFCHALETYRQELLERGDSDGLSSLPQVTCFERAPCAGGVWRSERSFEGVEETAPGEKLTNMYEALWTNGPKDNIEFFDYTFQDHFGDAPLPVYMPRQPILEYIIGRCTHKCPDFFEKYMQFHTSVVHVKYTENKFQVTTKHVLTGEARTEQYDKCIWSAGENGRPSMPGPLLKIFKDFPGRLIHSSDTADFENDCKGKRVLLVGGSYSAEDLALMAIKVGAERVFVSTRQAANAEQPGDAVSWTGAWPFDKVEVLEEQIPLRVTDNGKCIQFTEVEWKFPDKYEPETGEVSTELRDIDTVIFCTGYVENTYMLDEPLREAVKRDPTLQLDVPEDWKMTENSLTKFLGDVKPKDVRWLNSHVTHPKLYRGMMIDNPNMMFILADVSSPLCGIDVAAWLLVKIITGQREIPSREEMWTQNMADAIHEMQSPCVRFVMDKAYYDAYNHAMESDDREAVQKAFEEAYAEHAAEGTDEVIYYRFLARMMQEAQYPVDYGSFEELSEQAETIIHYDDLSYYHRHNLDGTEPWRTFRDYNDGYQFKSILTGRASVPLKQKWLDIDAADSSILDP
jgi:thioredoxin reductase